MRTVLALLLLASPLFADIVHLKNGRKVEGKILEEAVAYITIQTDNGKRDIMRSEIEKIEKKPWSPPRRKGPPVPKKVDTKLVTVYRDPFANFRILFPKDWTMGEHDLERFVFVGRRAGSYVPQLELEIRQNREVVRDYARKLNETLKGTQSELKVGTRPAVRILVNAVTKMLMTIIEASDRKFVFTYTAAAIDFDPRLRLVDDVIGSFRAFRPNKLKPSERKDFQRLYNEGIAVHNGGHYRAAVKLLEQAKKLCPNYPEIHKAISQSQLGVDGRPTKKVIDPMKQAIKLDPDNYNYRTIMTNYLISRNKLKDALKHAERAAELAPWMESAWTNLGIVQTLRSKWKEAKASFQAALKINPKSIPATYNLGIMYLRRGRPADAEVAFKQVLHFDPNHAGAKQGLADIDRLRR